MRRGKSRPYYDDIDLTETRSLSFTEVFEPPVPPGRSYSFSLEIDEANVDTVAVTMPGAP